MQSLLICYESWLSAQGLSFVIQITYALCEWMSKKKIKNSPHRLQIEYFSFTQWTIQYPIWFFFCFHKLFIGFLLGYSTNNNNKTINSIDDDLWRMVDSGWWIVDADAMRKVNMSPHLQLHFEWIEIKKKRNIWKYFLGNRKLIII